MKNANLYSALDLRPLLQPALQIPTRKCQNLHCLAPTAQAPGSQNVTMQKIEIMMRGTHTPGFLWLIWGRCVHQPQISHKDNYVI